MWDRDKGQNTVRTGAGGMKTGDQMLWTQWKSDITAYASNCIFHYIANFTGNSYIYIHNILYNIK